jgi:hypothetical protein
MTPLRTYLLVSTLVIFAVSIYVVSTAGVNWPAVYFGDQIRLDWRSQFNTDFLLHLGLLANWIAWREGFSAKGWLFGVLSIFMGGMFSFPYLLLATYKVQGNPTALLLGVRETPNAS